MLSRLNRKSDDLKCLKSRSADQDGIAPVWELYPNGAVLPCISGYNLFALERDRSLWLVDDFCKGAGQFGGANPLTHGDEQLVCCSIG
jgi:hypothetical protein